MQPWNKKRIIKATQKVDAEWVRNSGLNNNGGTPLAKAIDIACLHACRKFINTNVIILSDGSENCGGDPVSAIRRWQGLHVKIVVNTIGFAVDYETQKQLQRISMEGQGRYLDARNEKQLDYAVDEAVRMLPPPR